MTLTRLTPIANIAFKTRAAPLQCVTIPDTNTSCYTVWRGADGGVRYVNRIDFKVGRREKVYEHTMPTPFRAVLPAWVIAALGVH